MNLSGKAVRYWLDKENIPSENRMVITDDINLSFGQIRIRAKGSHGGHNGLRNIIETLGTERFARLRIGVGKDFAPGEQVDYVLGRWSEAEIRRLPGIIDRVLDALRTWLLEGVQKAMTLYNRKPAKDE